MKPTPTARLLHGLIPRGLSLLQLLAPGSFAAPTNDLSLSDSYPLAKIETVLLPLEKWRPFPTLADRPGWERLPAEALSMLVKQGQSALSKPMPALPATLYLAYTREGDRSRFEGPYFDRRRRLHQLVLAECAEARGRFMDAIADTLWALCEESTWCIPAHVGAQKAGVGLPDVEEPIVDLFAAQTASSVAWTLYLAGRELDGVSPQLRRRASMEVQRRVLTPFLERDFGWMGFGSNARAGRPNNWNPWINGNVLASALILEPDPSRRVALVHRVLRSLDRFLQPYPSDGGCDEGPGYWSRAGGSVLDNLDLLLSATAGRVDKFGHPLIAEIGRFIHRVHIADDWFVALGDCAARTGIDRDVVFRYGRRIGDPQLAALGSAGASLEELVRDTAGTDLERALYLLSDLDQILAQSGAQPPLVRDAWLGSEDLQMMVARDREGSTRGFFVAAWGGHNAQSHNHNDVGNFLLFADGQPVIIDLGAPTYTARTFSSRRYEIPAMQSAWHNLPTVHGVLQSAGREFAAEQVTYHAGEDFAELGMEIARAWPEAAGLRSWRRTVRLDREKEVTLVDAFQLSGIGGDTQLNYLLTSAEPRAVAAGQLELPPPRDGSGARRAVTMLFDSPKLQAAIEPFDVDDSRLIAVWGKRLHRIHVSAVSPVEQDTWVLRFRLPR